MQVRLATRLDLGALAEVHVRSWQEAYVGQVPQDHLDGLSIEQRTRAWTGTLDALDPRAAILVLVDDGTVVGFAHVCPSRDPGAGPGVGEITSIYLHPSQWRRGGGRALMSAALDALRQRGFTDAILWVLRTNVRAQRFYESTGWLADGATKYEPIGGTQIEEVRYRRVVSP
jgi:ribosomal protein S18 acetylase RimI-like enzyme